MFIVIETHGGPAYAIICCDIEGNNLVFDTKEEAEKYSEDECQDGVVIDLNS